MFMSDGFALMFVNKGCVPYGFDVSLFRNIAATVQIQFPSDKSRMMPPLYTDIGMAQQFKINHNDIHAKTLSVDVDVTSRNYSSNSFGPHISLL